MATFEEYELAKQFVLNVNNLRRDMRENAESYKRAVDESVSPDQIKQVLKGNSAEYLSRRLQNYCKVFLDDPDKRAKLDKGLTAAGLSISEADSIYDELKSAADLEAAAKVDTGAELKVAADVVLSAITSYDLIW